MPRASGATGKPRGKCYVCANLALRDFVNARLAEGGSMSGIWREAKEAGYDCGYASVRVHVGHTSLPQVAESKARTEGMKPKDLAVVVRDRTLEAVESGELTPGDRNWRNVTPGLQAQALLDRREAQKDNKQIHLQFLALLSGSPLAGIAGPPPRLMLGDGEDIEGEFQELTAVGE